jgi:hypothetical protein
MAAAKNILFALPSQAIPPCKAQTKSKSCQVRTRISYMDNDQLEEFLLAAKEHGPREHAMFLFAVAHGAKSTEQPFCSLFLESPSETHHLSLLRIRGGLSFCNILARRVAEGFRPTFR